MTHSHFIEQYKTDYGEIKSSSLQPINNLKWALQASAKFNVNTIAVFKVGERNKPMLGHYDFKNQLTVINAID